MSIAILGAGGGLGATVVEQAISRSDQPIYAFYHHTIPATDAAISPHVLWQPLDLADPRATCQSIERIRPQVIINCASMTDVDGCEMRRSEALTVNGLGPRLLAQACVRLGAYLVHMSTDYVFPGDQQQPGPYDEEASVRPVNHYGWSKLEGERAIFQTCAGRSPWLVVRSSLLYGHMPGGRTSFVKWLVGELRAGRRVKIVNDQANTPTLIDDLAAALLHLVHGRIEGILHVAGPELITRDAWARAIAEHYDLDAGLIDVTTSASLRQRAQRPLLSGLRTKRQMDLRGIRLHGVQEGLDLLQLAEQ